MALFQTMAGRPRYWIAAALFVLVGMGDNLVMNAFVVEQLRGGFAEAEHRVHACAVDRAGNVLWHVGEDRTSTFRSAAKPFQLEVSLRLLPEPLQDVLTSADLALGSASHHGEPEHVAAVSQLLSKLACGREQLLCGAHEPTSVESTRQLYARGELPDVLHNNCSGKHAFMASACACNGYARDYRTPSHPLQEAIANQLSARTGMHNIPTVVDGCGIPSFVLPLSAMARCYAQLADSVANADGSHLARVGAALMQHPILMSGHGAFDGWLNSTATVIAKVGAQGLLCLAVPHQRVGIAIKVESGVDSARPVATIALLQRFLPGLLSEALPERFFVVRNVVGARVGEQVCRA